MVAPSPRRGEVAMTTLRQTASEQFHQMASGQGFIAALDQSGGSTPRALHLYGVES